MVRWIFGALLILAGGVFWFGTMIADPYTAWGVEHEQVRPGVARIGINLAAIAIMLHVGAAGVIFSIPRNRKGWSAILIGLLLLFLIGTAAARLIWVQFYVLGQ